MSEYSERAKALFLEGYNCSQAVFAAYAPLFGMDKETALRASAGLGGGVGRMREVCGTVTGAAMVAGLKYGAVRGDDRDAKKETYEKVRAIADEFKKENPSIVCRELLGLSQAEKSAEPEKRDAGYYKKRPCVQLVEDASLALEKILFSEGEL